MKTGNTAMVRRADELRAAFDRSFAEPPAGDGESAEAFLAIDVGDDHYALRLAEISGLHTDKKIVSLPGASPELLGLTSFHGVLAPVYDLRVLLGYSANTASRWLVLLSSSSPVAVAFEGFKGYINATRNEIASDASSTSNQRRHVTQAMRTNDQLRLIVSLSSILESIQQRAQSGARQGSQ